MKTLLAAIDRRLDSLMHLNLGVLHQYPPKPSLDLSIANPPPVPRPAPGISIVTPSFNQAHFIGRTIDSVLNQGYPNLEYVVQDGASSDSTVDLLKAYGDRLPNWASAPDQGQSDALNLGFARCSGEIMAYLNSDDLLMPGSLALVADFFHRNPGVDVLYGHRLVIDEQDREIGRWFLPRHDPKVLLYADYIPQETLFWRRTIWEKAGGRIDASFHFAMDWDLLLRFQDAGARIRRLPVFLGAFRVHPASKTQSVLGDLGMREMERLRKRSLGYVPNYLEVRRQLTAYMLKAWTLQHIHEKPWLGPLAPIFE